MAEEGALSVMRSHLSVMGSHRLVRACKPLGYASCPRVKSYAATLASWSQVHACIRTHARADGYTSP